MSANLCSSRPLTMACLHELLPSVADFLEKCLAQASLLAFADVGEESYRCRLAVAPACGHASTDPFDRPYHGINGRNRFHKVPTC